jgi:hypothetical protein
MANIRENRETIAEILKYPEDLTEWETKFIQSVHEQLEEKRNPTEKQEHVIDEIFRKVVG